jgi:hypothetical protein
MRRSRGRLTLGVHKISFLEFSPVTIGKTGVSKVKNPFQAFSIDGISPSSIRFYLQSCYSLYNATTLCTERWWVELSPPNAHFAR